LGEQEVFALDWGLRLKVPRPVAPDITHIGIRAHDFQPVWEDGPEEGAYNRIRMAITHCSEDPFERILLFTNADAHTPGEKGELWWKFSKYLFQGMPAWLFIPPESLLLLRS
jgi:molybdate transport system ATP-binding protein